MQSSAGDVLSSTELAVLAVDVLAVHPQVPTFNPQHRNSGEWWWCSRWYDSSPVSSHMQCRRLVRECVEKEVKWYNLAVTQTKSRDVYHEKYE